MRPEERFDSFYRARRTALLHQCFALTGDLPAAQNAVRDAFVAAWHHWRKADAHDAPESWVRPRAWALAHRRHSARIWHRTKDISDEQRATLDALARMPYQQRRLLLLAELAGLDVPEAAREAGLTREQAARQLQEAASLFALQRNIAPAAVQPHLQDLGRVAEAVMLPRPPAVRRAGRRRRRTHTVVAAVAAVGVTLLCGAIAYEPAAGSAAAPALTGRHPPAPATTTPPRPADVLLDAAQVARLGRHQNWMVVPSTDLTQPLDQQCRAAPFPDPRRTAGLVRAFQAVGDPSRTVVQRVEVSPSAQQARQAFTTTLAWYSGCEMGRLQLMDSYRVGGVGDAAVALRFRWWQQPATTFWVAVARVSRVVTSTVSATGSSAGAAGSSPKAGSAPGAQQVAESLAEAVSVLCGQGGPAQGAPGCLTTPALSVVPPPAEPAERGLLSAVDLPPVGEVSEPWVGTTPEAPGTNPAATTCDEADFRAAGAVQARTRTFLMPEAKLPSRFGLSETYGVFGSPGAARRFMTSMDRRVDHCEQRHLATAVHPGLSARGRGMQLRAWTLDTAVSNRRSVTFRLGFVRVGGAVAEVTFSPVAGADIPARRFHALLRRAGECLRSLPELSGGPAAAIRTPATTEHRVGS